MEKEPYEALVLEAIEFDEDDVITSSCTSEFPEKDPFGRETEAVIG